MTFDKLKARWERERRQHIAEARTRREALRTRAAPLFEGFGIRQAVLFGSVLGGESHPTSDIDLFVAPLAQTDYWRFRQALEAALGYRVDLYTQADDPNFVGKIWTLGEVIYEAKRGAP